TFPANAIADFVAKILKTMIHGLSPSLSCLKKSPLNSHSRELNFVTILTEGLCTADGGLTCLGCKALTDQARGKVGIEIDVTWLGRDARFACQGLFSVLGSPGDRCHMSQNHTSTLYCFAIHLKSDRCCR